MISEFGLTLYQLDETSETESQIFSMHVPTYEMACEILKSFRIAVQGEIEVLFENGLIERIPISNSLKGLEDFQNWKADFLSSICA